MVHKNSDGLDDACLTLNWYDVQDILSGHHPLLMLKLIMQFDVVHNPPTRLEVGDQLSNAEYLCRVLREANIFSSDLAPIAREIHELTHGLTFVADDVVTEIISLALRRGLSRGVLRRKSLMDATLLKPIKRDVPLARGANYADPENKAFPLDTPDRVRASHAYIHKFWNNNAQSGITATYNRDKFIQVHKKIATRMRRLGMDHSTRDSLDRATRNFIKKQLSSKGVSVKKGGAPRGATPRDGGLGALSPDMMDAEDIRKTKNMLQSVLSDHVSFLKNYISACDERNDGVAKSMETALESNTNELGEFIKKHLAPYTPDDPMSVDDDEAANQFAKLWVEYMDSVKSMVIGGDTGNDSMAKSGLRALFLVKDKIVKYFVSLLAEIAEEEELDEAWTNWVKYLQGYIESRDNDDFATSYQNLQDWKKAKDVIAQKLAQWIISRDNISSSDIAEAKPLDVDGDNSAADSPIMGKTTNPPAPLAPPTKTANDVRRNASNSPDSGANSLSPNASQPDGSRNTRRLNEARPLSIGHRPHGEHCMPDARNGKCYVDHKSRNG